MAAIGQNLSAEGAEVYDATGLIAAPGLIDIHTHLRNQAKKRKKISTWYTSGCRWWFHTCCNYG